LIRDKLVLGFDTSAAHCAAALLLNDNLLGIISKDMLKGQAETIGPMVLNLLETRQVDIQNIKRIGVGIGPGNFTGIRIAVSFARGLGLSLQIPVIGVDSFEATYLGNDGNAIVTVPAPRNEVYFQAFPRTKIDPQIALLDEVLKRDATVIERCTAKDLVENISRIAAMADLESLKPAAPLYIKAPDATPSRDTKPKILS
jgi:tRNA threonylcarbamoyl adenosine modification protein YeaZ